MSTQYELLGLDWGKVEEAQGLIAEVSHALYHRGYSEATSSNYSLKLSDQYIAISSSGIHKGKMKPEDIMIVDFEGKAVNSHLTPSAETKLHCQIYQALPHIGCVLHTHSIAMTVLGRLIKGHQLSLEGYEMLKALEGVKTHEMRVEIPIVENHQDMDVLKEQLRSYFSQNNDFWAYLIRNHGLYTWGKNISACIRQLEALEFMGKCELELFKHK